MQAGRAVKDSSEPPPDPPIRSYSLGSALCPRIPHEEPIQGLRIGTVDPPRGAGDNVHNSGDTAPFTPSLYIRKQVGKQAPQRIQQPEGHIYFKIDKLAPLSSEELLQNARIRIQQETAALIDANKHLLDTCNKYTPYKARLPEIVEIERKRMLNLRYLLAEEEKIRMECTKELVDGVHRRYLPTTIGRRAPIISDEVQTAKHFADGLQELQDSRNVVLRSQQEMSKKLAKYFAEQVYN
ncbi:Hypothetical protein GLP15_1820 [Giardia lamblia P15]|uniref:Uncharacterized protein n=1 Tax=Giardia intestinalis (strain P15) TaxID=658858 RepID=E1EYJ3_GIAIA|nr:Hypothetical protein GLP15_1820 [Giardia lamblia P15]